MLNRLFKKDCIIKRPVTIGTKRTKTGKYNLDNGTDAKIKGADITEKEMTVFSLTMRNHAYLIKGIDSIPEGSVLIYNDKEYDLDKVRELRNIHDKLEGFKVFV